MRLSRRRAALRLLALAALLAAGCQTRDAKPFNAKMDEYLARPSAGGAGDMDRRPQIKGKVVIVDRKARLLDDMHWDLSGDLRADTPDEVGTVVWVDWGSESVGTYTTGRVATISTCTVSVIDFASHTLLARKVFKGAEPPYSVQRPKSEKGPIEGPKPTGEILTYLESLPH
jgi:hypothetical protein